VNSKREALQQYGSPTSVHQRYRWCRENGSPNFREHGAQQQALNGTAARATEGTTVRRCEARCSSQYKPSSPETGASAAARPECHAGTPTVGRRQAGCCGIVHYVVRQHGRYQKPAPREFTTHTHDAQNR